jgi:hypothetical protein
MPDLFRQDSSGGEPLPSTTDPADDADDSGTFGGHNLRQTIRTPFGQQKPRSATQGNQEKFTTYIGPGGRSFVEPTHERTVEYEDSDGSNNDGSHNEDIIEVTTTQNQRRVQFASPVNTTVPGAPTVALATSPATPTTMIQIRDELFPAQPFPNVTVRKSSGLASLMAVLGLEPDFATDLQLRRQPAARNDLKAFRQEILNATDTTVFAFMHPGSVYIHLLHNLRLFTNQLGDLESVNTVFGFVGDSVKPFRHPAAVSVPDKLWKWVSRKVDLDVTKLEEFYSVPENKRKFFHPTSKKDEQLVTVPRLLLLSPLLTAFCCETPRTPFELHQFVATMATDDTQPVSIDDCNTLFDWCITASHHETASPTSSVLATVLAQPPAFDDILHEWLHNIQASAFPTSDAPLVQSVLSGKGPAEQEPRSSEYTRSICGVSDRFVVFRIDLRKTVQEMNSTLALLLQNNNRQYSIISSSCLGQWQRMKMISMVISTMPS